MASEAPPTRILNWATARDNPVYYVGEQFAYEGPIGGAGIGTRRYSVGPLPFGVERGDDGPDGQINLTGLVGYAGFVDIKFFCEDDLQEPIERTIRFTFREPARRTLGVTAESLTVPAGEEVTLTANYISSILGEQPTAYSWTSNVGTLTPQGQQASLSIPSSTSNGTKVTINCNASVDGDIVAAPSLELTVVAVTVGTLTLRITGDTFVSTSETQTTLTVTLGGTATGDATYSWSGPPAAQLSGTTNRSVIYTPTRTTSQYTQTVSVSVTRGGAMATASINVVVDAVRSNLPAPGNIRVSEATGSTTITWGAVSGATGYQTQVRRATVPSWTSSGVVSNTYTAGQRSRRYTSLDGTAIEDARFRVRALPDGLWSNDVTFDIRQAAVAGNFRVTSSSYSSSTLSTRVNFAWNDYPGRQRYFIQLRWPGLTTWGSVLATTTSGNSATFTVNRAGTFGFRLIQRDAQGTGSVVATISYYIANA